MNYSQRFFLTYPLAISSLLTVLVLISSMSCTPSAKMSQASDTSSGLKTLAYLREVSGKQTVAGIHNREPNDSPARWTNHVYTLTGKYPALWSGDFLFQSENIANRQLMIDEAVRQWNKGALINIMWHACNPVLEEPCGWDSLGVKSKLSDPEWTALITDGTKINQRWKGRLDEVAGYLLQLQDKGVEVLWRPMHEMNQGVFWWGGRPGPNGTRKLYQLMHDYFQNVKKLHNLVWVWDIQDFNTLAADAESYNPGAAYYDVAALDVYDDGSGYSQEKYEVMVKAAAGKPMAIGECQKYPSPEELEKQPRWTFFMGWSELVFSDNTTDQLKKLFNATNVITLDEKKQW